MEVNYGRNWFLFAFDVDWSDETPSGLISAERHFGSGPPPTQLGDKMYTDLRLWAAVLALTTLGLIDTLIIPGKDEKRRKGATVIIDGKECPPWQGYLIRQMLLLDYGIDPSRVRWTPSTDGDITEVSRGAGNSTMAATVMKRYTDQHRELFADGQPCFITNDYHEARVRMDLADAGFISPKVFSAESLILLDAYRRSKQAGDGCREQLFRRVNEPDYVRRMVNDRFGGVAEKLAQTYDSSNNRRGW